MLVTPSGMDMEVSEVTPWKAPNPMEVSLLPCAKVTLEREDAFLNANNPIVVTLAGMEMEVRADAPSNVDLGMELIVVPSAKVTVLSPRAP